MVRKIKFIYFDIGGVLVKTQSTPVLLSKKYGIQEKKTIELFNFYHDSLTKGEMSILDFLSLMREMDHTDEINYIVANYVPIKKTHSFLKEISKKYKVGLLSNNYLGVFNKLVEQRLIPHVQYEEIVLSCDVGFMKPEKEIFLFAQKRAKTRTNEILFIDNKKKNIKMAGLLGWQTILFETGNVEKSIKKIRTLL